MLPNFAYARPDTLKDAVKQLADEGTRLYAGGTDLLGCLRDGVFGVQKIVSISKLNSLRGIDIIGNGGLRIGALTTITEVAEHPLIQSDFTALAKAAGEVASPQLRNQGTIGGNICQKPRCWYYRGEFHCLRKGGDTCYAAEGENQYHGLFGSDDICYIVHPSDTASALTALGAQVRISGLSGEKVVPIDAFFVPPAEDVQKETILGTDEIVTDILLPSPRKGLKSSYRKVRARRSWDFALAGIALAVAFEDEKVAYARAVLSGAAPIPWRALAVEENITGQKLTSDIISKAAAAAVEDAEPLEKNGYKVPLFKGLVEQELAAIGLMAPRR
jgi:xanthine dehydrogenase YagS FAD-binding subunit